MNILNNIEKSKRNHNFNIRNVAQAAEHAKWCLEDTDVRKMFAKLIAAEFDTDKAVYVATSFPHIIRQLSQDDAVILKLLSNKGYFGPIPMLSIKDSFVVSGSYFLRGYVKLFDEKLKDDKKNSKRSIATEVKRKITFNGS